MAIKPVKPKPVKSSLPQLKTISIEPEQAFVDPLTDVPLYGPITDRFEIQPGDITLITVGSIEVVVYPSSEEEETEPTPSSAGQPSKRPKDET